MSSQPPTQWNPGRFLQTLSYFGAVPFLSNVDWFQQWFGSRPDPKVDSDAMFQTPVRSFQTAPPILVIGSDVVGQAILQQGLAQGLAQGQSVQVVVPTAEQILPVQALAPAAQVMLLPDFLAQPMTPDHAVVCSEWTADLVPLIAHCRNLGLEYRPLFDFSQPSLDLKEIWGALDDVVMGGVSQSSFRLGDGVAYFSGTVSTANSGGFASVRTRNLAPALNLSEFEGIELRLKGDGQRYKFMLRTESQWDGVAYSRSFDTQAGEWITVRIPFSELIAVFRARTVPNRPIDPSGVCAMQLMLSKFEYDGALNPQFEPGLFQLQVASIRAYRQSDVPKFVLIAPVDTVPGVAQAVEALEQNQVPYTILRPNSIQPTSGDRFNLSTQPLNGSVDAAAVAAIALAALNHPQVRNRTLFVAATENGWPLQELEMRLAAG